MPPRPEPQLALGQVVRGMRQSRGLTQEVLAHVAGVHPTWISRLEGGKLNPSWGMVSRIADALGVGVGELARAAAERKRK